jgi:hypothetical protein
MKCVGALLSDVAPPIRLVHLKGGQGERDVLGKANTHPAGLKRVEKMRLRRRVTSMML